MRNLRILSYRTAKTVSLLTSSCWDSSTDECLVTTGPTTTDEKVELHSIIPNPHPRPQNELPLKCTQAATWDVPSPSLDLPSDHIINSHHFPDTSTTCLIFAGGDIVIVQNPHHGSGAAHIEIVGSIDATITAARWSPDEELLVLASAANTLIFMSRSFDPVAEAALTAEDLKASKHVSVGWGKKETQFHGKGAKAKGGLRDPTIPEKVDEGVLSAHDDGRTTISWRGDGAYVAINSVEGARRVLRVFARDGALDSASEPVDGLEGALSWRPEGNLLAGIQRLGGRVDVVFFERNGLRHGQFTLRGIEEGLTQGTQITLEWNSASTVLAVMFGERVQLWTMGNYHWYLKQELRFDKACKGLSWHPQKALHLSVTAGAETAQLELIQTVMRGSTRPPYDHGAIGVVDGTTVKLTPFRTVNMPPPMSMFELEAASPVVDVAFGKDDTKIAILHQEGVDVYDWPKRDGRALAPVRRSQHVLEANIRNAKGRPLQLCFGSDDTIYLLRYSDGLSIATPQSASGETADSSPEAALAVDNDVLSLYSSHTASDVWMQDSTGQRRVLDEGEFDRRGLKPPVFLPWLEVALVGEDVIGFGLSRSGHLYANSRLLAKNCTSFLLTPEHLIFTTSNHILKFVHLNGVEELEVPSDDHEKDERCRSLERGARLVQAMPSALSVVLQMPRGNLETIYPRAMVLAGTRHLIDDREYGKAFAHCRTQRVDMNILYDHKPEQFLGNIALFLDQLKDATYVDLFLSSLKAEDVTQTMYLDTRSVKAAAPGAADMSALAAPGFQQPSKVNAICNAVLEVLHTKKNANLQNIITAHVCKNPPAIEDGLRVVQDLMQEDEGLAERAVEHICFLQDVNKLYDHALGLYDLNLTLLVAQQAQRDPKEYLPFVQNLHQMPELRKKFAIDDHLNRRSKALGHLKSLNAFEELQKYMIRHKLYTEALALYRYNETHHDIIANLYAEHLESLSRWREAGIAYESLSKWPKATECYRQAGSKSWRETLYAAQQYLAVPSTELTQLAKDLALGLIEDKDYFSASQINLQYLDSLEDAARSLCKGFHFADAMRLIAFHKQLSLLTSIIDPGLTDALSSMTDLLADCKSQLRAQIPRILELRRKAIDDPLGFYEGDKRLMEGDIPDDISIAASSRLSTSASLFTRYTGKAGSVGTLGSNVSRASSKNRKREEKKRARGRKGTVYEEEYLVNSVKRLVERVDKDKEDVRKLIEGLVRRKMLERARAVEGLLSEVVDGCRVAVDQVWGKQEMNGQANGGALDEDVGDAAGSTPSGHVERPALPKIERLSLLA